MTFRKHKTKKIMAGLYLYRGWEIHKNEDFCEYTCWNMTPPNGHSAVDAGNTLSEAKAMIDYWADECGHNWD